MTTGRPHKRTVEYFPHPVSHDRVIYILQEAYGNDGYAFWHKLKEALGETPGHFINCQKPGSWEHLIGKMKIKNGKAETIIGTLANIEAIDTELWDKYRVIWSQDFVEDLRPVYSKRGHDLPSSPEPGIDFVSSGPQMELFGAFRDGKTQKEGIPPTKEVKELKRGKEGRNGIRTGVIEEILEDRFNRFWKAYPKKRSKGQARKTFYKLNPSEELLEKILKAIENWKTVDDWKEKKGKYIQNPSTWLNAEGWEDEIPEPRKKESWVPPEERSGQ